jgi:hypothetical protein
MSQGGSGEEDLDYEEDLLGGDPIVPGLDGAQGNGAGGAHGGPGGVDFPPTDFAALVSDPARLAAILQSLQAQGALAAEQAAAAAREGEKQAELIRNLKSEISGLRAGRPTESKNYVPLCGDNDFYPPNRLTLPDPTRPRLLPLLGKDRVYDALVGRDPHHAPNGRALDWATIVSVTTFFADFLHFFEKEAKPLLAGTGAEGRLAAERLTNTGGEIFQLLEQRYDYLHVSTLLHANEPDLSRGFFDRIYSEFLTGLQAREGSDWSDFHAQFLERRDTAVQKFAAQQAAGRLAGRDLREEIGDKRHNKKKKGQRQGGHNEAASKDK